MRMERLENIFIRRQSNNFFCIVTYMQFFVLVFLFCFRANGQDFSINASLDTNKIMIGEQIKLKVKVIKSGRGYDFGFPILLDTVAKNVEIVEQSQIDTIPGNGSNVTLNKEYTITSFEPGIQIIPPLKFALQHNNRIDTVESNSLHLEVFAMKLDTTNRIFDIKKPYEAPLTWTEFFHRYYPIIIAVLAVILVIILIIIFYYRKKDEKPLIKLSRPKLPPHTIALNALDELKQKKLWQQDKVKRYYSELTEILRIYIEEKFKVNALEQTSDEILDALSEKRFYDNELNQKLAEILKLSDLVKFAKHKPLPDENGNCIDLAYTFVKSTIFVDDYKKPESAQPQTNNETPTEENKTDDKKEEAKSIN